MLFVKSLFGFTVDEALSGSIAVSVQSLTCLATLSVFKECSYNLKAGAESVLGIMFC